MDPITKESVISMETYFLPDLTMFEGTFFDVLYPDEIFLPDGDLDLTDEAAVTLHTRSDLISESNLTFELTCGSESESIRCYRLIENTTISSIRTYKWT